MSSRVRGVRIARNVKSALDRIVPLERPLGKKIAVLLKRYLDARIEECNRRIREYETKYGSSYSIFKAHFKTMEEHTWETESDLFDWGAAITDLQVLEETMRRLGREEE